MEKPDITVWQVLVWGTVGIPTGSGCGYAKQHCVLCGPYFGCFCSSCRHQRLDFSLFAWRVPDVGKSPDVVFL